MLAVPSIPETIFFAATGGHLATAADRANYRRGIAELPDPKSACSSRLRRLPR